jgi:small-conductance mechanosensitive channel
MKMHKWLPIAGLGALVIAAAAGLVLTRPLAAPPAAAAEAGVQAPAAPTGGKRPRLQPIVDEKPLQTARTLEPLARTPEEQQLAHQAVRVANHEVDLAYADALHQAAETPPAPTPQIQALLAQKTKAQEAVNEDRQLAAGLTRKLAAAAERDKEALQTQLDVANGQLELDQDELDQAGEDLERAGGDPQAWIRRLQAAHAAADSAPPQSTPAPALFQSASLLGKYGAWSALRDQARKLAQAAQDATDKEAQITQRRALRAAKVAKEKEGREQAKVYARGLARGENGDAQDRDLVSGTIDLLKDFTRDQRLLADLGRRIQDEQELAGAYGSWEALVQARQRAALNELIRWSLGALLVLFLVLLADRMFQRRFTHLAEGNKRVGRMLKVLRFAVLALGTMGILLILFGLPNQVTTLFGLAGAGLTVALKDFIVAFFGWFVLVGRNGIHVGDWVEINGVGGEVVEIGLLRTMLLETGSWSDCGHPTGRIVSFVNSFAIEGHFFNFSTSGQWMWDEIHLAVPASQDPYQLIDAVLARVEQETAANAHLAEQEWQKSAGSRRVQGFSAQPAVNLVPTGSAVEIRVRYITRAYERHQTRLALNQAMVGLLHGHREAAAQA